MKLSMDKSMDDANVTKQYYISDVLVFISNKENHLNIEYAHFLYSKILYCGE